jgi:hypothetical protein
VRASLVQRSEGNRQFLTLVNATPTCILFEIGHDVESRNVENRLSVTVGPSLQRQSFSLFHYEESMRNDF